MALTGADLAIALGAGLFFPAKALLPSLPFLASPADFLAGLAAAFSLGLELFLSVALETIEALFFNEVAVAYLLSSGTDAVLAGFALDLSAAFNYFGGADFDLDFAEAFTSFTLGLLDEALAAPFSALSFALGSGFLAAAFFTSLGADADLLSFFSTFKVLVD